MHQRTLLLYPSVAIDQSRLTSQLHRTDKYIHADMYTSYEKYVVPHLHCDLSLCVIYQFTLFISQCQEHTFTVYIYHYERSTHLQCRFIDIYLVPIYIKELSLCKGVPIYTVELSQRNEYPFTLQIYHYIMSTHLTH